MMFDDVVANIVAIGALIVLTVFGLGLLSTLAEPSSRGIPYNRHHERPEHPKPAPKPEPHKHHRPAPKPEPHKHPKHQKMVGGCGSTRFGCCPDGKTARADDRGSNCPSIGDSHTKTVADKHHDVPAYSHTSSSPHGTELPRAADHPTMTPSQTQPASTLLLISETATNVKAGFAAYRGRGKGFILGVKNLFGGMREGLTAKDQSEAEEKEEARMKTLDSAAKKMVDKCCSKPNKDMFEKFATLMDATAAQMVKDLIGQAPHAIQSKDYSSLQSAQKKIEDLTSLASAARRLTDVGPASI